MLKGLFIEPLPDGLEPVHAANAEDAASAATFGSARRRIEYLAWRAIVRRRLGADVRIGYTKLGAPCLPDHPDIYIGVSHCSGWVAVCISDRPCAVDIESVTRDFSRTAARFISPGEQALSDDPQLPALIWCAKECLYKLAGGIEGADLLDDLHIAALDTGSGTITGTIRGGAPVELRFKSEHGLIVVYKV